MKCNVYTKKVSSYINEGLKFLYKGKHCVHKCMSKTCIYEKKIWLEIKQFHFRMVRNFTMCVRLWTTANATMCSELNQVFHYFIFDLLVYMFVIWADTSEMYYGWIEISAENSVYLTAN